jgi:hypothetical protein
MSVLCFDGSGPEHYGDYGNGSYYQYREPRRPSRLMVWLRRVWSSFGGGR